MLSYRYPFKKKLKEIHQTINMDSTERTINKRIFANDVSGLEQDSENEIQSENDISENEYSHNESSYLHEGSSINNGQTTSESDNDNDSDADSFSSDSTYLGPENYGFNSRRRSFAMFRGLVNDDDTVSEHSYDEDEDYLLDASGNRIRETYKERKYRILGQSPYFLELPRGFQINQSVFPHDYQIDRRHMYGTRVEDDENGNHVYIQSNPIGVSYKTMKYVFKKPVYGPEKMSAWPWFCNLIRKEELSASKEIYKKDKDRLDFAFNPRTGHNILNVIQSIVQFRTPEYMEWVLTLPEILDRFYEIPLQDTMSDIEKIREVFGHILCSVRHNSPLQIAIQKDSIVFVKWILEEVDGEPADEERKKRVSIGKYGSELFDNACKNRCILCVKYLVETYGLGLKIKHSSLASLCCSNYLGLAKIVCEERPDILLGYDNRHQLVKCIINYWRLPGKLESIRWIHANGDIDVYNTKYDIFIDAFTCNSEKVKNYYLKHFFPFSKEVCPDLAERILIKIIINSTSGIEDIGKLLEHFPDVDFQYNNNQPLKEAIVGGVLDEVKYISEKTNMQFFENYDGIDLIEIALLEEEDEITEYMMKRDAEHNSISLYERHPIKCDQIFNIMAKCSCEKSVRFLMNLNPKRYKVEISEDGEITDYSIETNIEELNIIQTSELDKEITSCLVCDDKTSNLYTKCGHMYCDVCLLSWLRKNYTCPYCREPLSMSNVCLIKH